MKRFGLLLAAALVVVGSATDQDGVAGQVEPAEPAAGRYLIIRSDDAGMTHAVNMATRKLLDTGLPVSVSIMFPTPWYQEAVEILRAYPNASVGVHLTLNSEWRHYRWGPVLGREAVPSLVDDDGFFFPSAADLYRNAPDLGEVERELRAQIVRALRTGLHFDYLDFHMGAAVRNPEFRAIVERLGSQYRLGLSSYYGEQVHDPQYRPAPPAKLDALLEMLERLEPGYHLLVTHPGLDTPELAALVDMNVSFPLETMSAHRQGELDALTAEPFAEALVRHGVTPITYRDLRAMTPMLDAPRAR